tara:strand:- start:2548 stop:3177 length:630 start_codon:yes stop_codon:yes gene_type:complete
MITVSDMNQARKQQNKKTTSGSIRIIAGKYRGRKLPVLMAEGLRPTTDRVKETLFNWLMPYIHGANCLDCFAGAGSLGFEALSRGAAKVNLIELNKNAAKQLLANKQLLKSTDVEVCNANVLDFLKTQASIKFDLVFIDPPFRQNLVSQTCELLEKDWLTEQALIYVEMEAEGSQQLPNNWQLLKEKIAGQVAYRLFQRTENQRSEDNQ